MPHFECGAFNHSATSPLAVVTLLAESLRRSRGLKAIFSEFSLTIRESGIMRNSSMQGNSGWNLPHPSEPVAPASLPGTCRFLKNLQKAALSVGGPPGSGVGKRGLQAGYTYDFRSHQDWRQAVYRCR